MNGKPLIWMVTMAHRLSKAFMRLTLLAAIVVIALPGVQAYASDGPVEESEPIGIELDGTAAAQAFLDTFEALAIEDGAMIVTANGGQTYRLDLDIGEMANGVLEPSGNSTVDLLKYSAIAGMFLPVVRFARRALRRPRVG